MMTPDKDALTIVILGLSITSSWGNGHATTYRGLVRELVAQGHDVTFLERDVPWYAANRDMPVPPWGDTRLYASLEDLSRHRAMIEAADVVIVGSFVPDGQAVGAWVQATARGLVAFYDIDTPRTLAALRAEGAAEYLTAAQIPGYDLYLSFTGGPTLAVLEDEFGAPLARALYCSVDDDLYYPEDAPLRWDLGYLGTYSDDRQPTVERLLNGPAWAMPESRFVVAGPQYPDALDWPGNVERIEHLPPPQHRGFYNAQRFTLNVTRADMIRAGYSPSVRLFEAAACATPIISDWWEGLDRVFTPGKEILIAHDAADAERFLTVIDEGTRRAIGEAARQRVLAHHTAAARAAELVDHCRDAMQASLNRRGGLSLAAAGGGS